MPKLWWRIAMVYVVETSEYAPGKREDALAFLRKAEVYYKRLAGLELHTVRRVTQALGQQAQLITIFTTDSVAAWEAFYAKRNKDTEWQTLSRDIYAPEKGCFVHNTYTRAFFEVI
jgi:hypothetical protein